MLSFNSDEQDTVKELLTAHPFDFDVLNNFPRPVQKTGRKPKSIEKKFCSADEMKVERAIRNRESAQASRERKKLQYRLLQVENKALKEANEALLKKLDNLEKQNISLQDQMSQVSAAIYQLKTIHDHSSRDSFLSSSNLGQIAFDSSIGRPSDPCGAALASLKKSISLLRLRDWKKLNRTRNSKLKNFYIWKIVAWNSMRSLLSEK